MLYYSFTPCLGQDLSGRPHLSYDLDIPTQRVGTYDTQVVHVFLITSSLSVEFCQYSFWLLSFTFIQLRYFFLMCVTYHATCSFHLSPSFFFIYWWILWISLFVVGGAFFPVISEHIWYDTSHSTGTTTNT